MVKKRTTSARKKKAITLIDVMTHISHMGQRHSTEMQDLEQRLTLRIDRNSHAIADLRDTLTQRIDALEEDLTATIKDTMKIRKHVGMPTSIED